MKYAHIYTTTDEIFRQSSLKKILADKKDKRLLWKDKGEREFRSVTVFCYCIDDYQMNLDYIE